MKEDQVCDIEAELEELDQMLSKIENIIIQYDKFLNNFLKSLICKGSDEDERI